MSADIFSGQHTSDSRPAIAAFEAAVVGVAAHRAGAAEGLRDALSAEPDFIAAHALKGFANLILARAELVAPARNALADGRASLARTGGTAGETALVGALAEAVEGRMLLACAILEHHNSLHPQDFLAIKLTNAMRFMMGDLDGMLAATSRVVGHWAPGQPGYGFVLGCHAFGLEEAGEFAAAEKSGLAAVRHEPRDAWGLHAVSHVYEMNGRITAGLALLESARPMWTQCHNFSFHMAWHLALLQLERGRHDLALDIYDHDVRPVSTDDFRDIANAASLLWRLRQERIDVGGRWEELAMLAQKRTQDTTLIFASLHHLMSLIAGGDLACAEALAASINTRAGSGKGDQAGLAGRVGADLARAMIDFARKGASRADMAAIAGNLPAIGGSHAQRDVFLRSLADMAVESGDGGMAAKVLDVRREFRHDDRFAAMVAKRLAALQAMNQMKFAS